MTTTNDLDRLSKEMMMSDKYDELDMVLRDIIQEDIDRATKTATNELRNELDRLSVAELENKIANLQTAVNLREEQAARLRERVTELVESLNRMTVERNLLALCVRDTTAEVEALRAVCFAARDVETHNILRARTNEGYVARRAFHAAWETARAAGYLREGEEVGK